MYRCSANAIIQVGLFSCFFLFCFVDRLLGFIASSVQVTQQNWYEVFLEEKVVFGYTDDCIVP